MYVRKLHLDYLILSSPTLFQRPLEKRFRQSTFVFLAVIKSWCYLSKSRHNAMTPTLTLSELFMFTWDVWVLLLNSMKSKQSYSEEISILVSRKHKNCISCLNDFTSVSKGSKLRQNNQSLLQILTKIS